MAYSDYYMNVTGFPDMLTATNYATHNLFGVCMLLVVFVVAFAIGSRLSEENAKDAAASASFITLLFSFFFGALNLISGDVVLVCIVLTGIVVFVLKR